MKKIENLLNCNKNNIVQHLFLQGLIEETIFHIEENIRIGFVAFGSFYENGITLLKKLGYKLLALDENNIDTNILHVVSDELHGILQLFGTYSLEQLLLYLEKDYRCWTSTKMEWIRKYFHPTAFQIFENVDTNKDCMEYMECMEYPASDDFLKRVYGLRVILYNQERMEKIMLLGRIDNVMVLTKEMELDNNYSAYLHTLMVKDHLLSTEEVMFQSFKDKIAEHDQKISGRSINEVVKAFQMQDLFGKRRYLILLYVFKKTFPENTSLAYLLFDLLLQNASNTSEEDLQQYMLNSFSREMKKEFMRMMKESKDFFLDIETPTAPLQCKVLSMEQQILLLTPESVKEKAIIKWKEIKSKAEDSSGTKPRQYLDGLLKIPFHQFRREPILQLMDEIKRQYSTVFFPSDAAITSAEITMRVSARIDQYAKEEEEVDGVWKYWILGAITTMTVVSLDELLKHMNTILKNNHKRPYAIARATKEKKKKFIVDFLDTWCRKSSEIRAETINIFKPLVRRTEEEAIQTIRQKLDQIGGYMTEIHTVLDSAVYGHVSAKREIEKILGHWVNGKQTGYCFGFEGPPGIGKTSLAKHGLSKCLRSDEGIPRPFAFIALGGDSNGSTLHGHNYTYVASSWGAIAQILMDTKCMNPIIFIDEVDKISHTEHGREITGVLTHLLDPAQNDIFQDKYFAGIHLDLSKALFILSYNDPSAIDRILLDRVHRVPFSALSVEEKVIICQRHLLPEILDKMGLVGAVEFPEEVLRFLIENYTCEAGVRKLKEHLFDIVGEINLDILFFGLNNQNKNTFVTIVSTENISDRFLKEKTKLHIRKVPLEDRLGYINGMYATTTIGNGGVLPIHAKFFPAETFLKLTLTGLQREVMRESMNVALTVAWSMTPEDMQGKLRKMYDCKGQKCGINIHTGENAVAKDGPSGGCAIALVLYSIFNNIQIRQGVAITGEIQISGEVTAIGGLSHKILGSIKQGIHTIVYPKENAEDFAIFKSKHEYIFLNHSISFYAIEHIKEAMNIVYLF